MSPTEPRVVGARVTGVQEHRREPRGPCFPLASVHERLADATSSVYRQHEEGREPRGQLGVGVHVVLDKANAAHRSGVDEGYPGAWNATVPCFPLPRRSPVVEIPARIELWEMPFAGKVDEIRAFAQWPDRQILGHQQSQLSTPPRTPPPGSPSSSIVAGVRPRRKRRRARTCQWRDSDHRDDENRAVPDPGGSERRVLGGGSVPSDLPLPVASARKVIGRPPGPSAGWLPGLI